MKNKRREGLWIEEYTQDSSHYKSIGKYRKGDPIKKWNYYLNGKIKSKGKTKMETSDKYAHWFYFGDWNFFNEDGKLITIKKYNNGESFSEIEIK
ncbi:MAG: hypothetical protein PHF81_04565 [Flavobacterium sp.]|nr:hypothetical protein [Flavobacterium sp.]